MISEEIDTRDDEQSFERIDDKQLTTADVAAATAPARSSRGEQDAAPTQATSGDEGLQPLFEEGETEEFRSRWYGIQSTFVDEPRRSVEEADGLVAAVMKRLAETFDAERQRLEGEWASGDDVSTEDLRIALRRYRSFFDRLLSV